MSISTIEKGLGRMNPDIADFIRDYLSSLSERDLWFTVTDFLLTLGLRAAVVHGSDEHGVDIVAHVTEGIDALKRGYNVVIQVKKGNVGLPEWRTQILGQLCEATYYPVTHECLVEHRARRVLLFSTGKLTNEARNAIRQFNLRHDTTIEVYELDDLVRWIGDTPFGEYLIQRTQGVGDKGLIPEHIPPAVGEPM